MTQDAYIVAARRTPVGKAPRGVFRRTRPDDLLSHVIRSVVNDCPSLDPADIEDVVVGCAMPEGEQGLNVARLSALMAGLPDTVPGMTVNRFCASGLQSIAMAADRIRLGEADVMIAGGVESMSLIPMGGNKLSMNPAIFDDDQVAIAYGMGITAENVAKQWKISRADQDSFALRSHQLAVQARDAGYFSNEIAPYTVVSHQPGNDGTVQLLESLVTQDEGPRLDTNLSVLGGLKPAFAQSGTVTAGNSSQMSDGAAAVMLMSEKRMSALGLEPLGRFMGYTVAGVAPEIMGIGPKEAIPKLCKQTGVKQDDIGWIELNEAFAAQALAVIQETGLEGEKVNPQGGAIALGHPLGATGAIRTTSLIHGLKRTGARYGMVTMCIGTGMGAAGLFELA